MTKLREAAQGSAHHKAKANAKGKGSQAARRQGERPMSAGPERTRSRRQSTRSLAASSPGERPVAPLHAALEAAVKAGNLLADIDKAGKEYCVVFADLADSTKYKIDHGLSRGALRAQLHNSLASRAISPLAVADKWLGDGYLAVVPTERANELLRRVHDFLESLETEGAQVTEFGAAMKTRVGVHAGLAVLVPAVDGRPADALGPGLDAASRVLEIAEPGGVYVTDAFRAHLTPAFLKTAHLQLGEERPLVTAKYVSSTPPTVAEVTREGRSPLGFRSGGTKDSRLEIAEKELREKDERIQRLEEKIKEDVEQSEEAVRRASQEIGDTVRSLLRLSRGHATGRSGRRSMLWLPNHAGTMLQIVGNSSVEGPELNLVLRKNEKGDWEGVAGEAFGSCHPVFASGSKCREYRLVDPKRVALVDARVCAIYAHPLIMKLADGSLRSLGVVVVDSRNEVDQDELVKDLRATLDGVGRVLTLLVSAFEPFFGIADEVAGEGEGK